MLPSITGSLAALLALYLEESGLPVPVAGDLLVLYLGSHFAHSLLNLVLVWLVLTAVVVAGSSNLYLLARRFGRPLLEHRLAPLLHLTPRRIDRAEGWFGRWGPLAVIVGRHVFGMRIPVTIAAGIFEMPYRSFAPSVAISTAIWSGAWLWLGARYGASVTGFLTHHRWAYLLGFTTFLILAASAAIKLLVGRSQRAAEGRAEALREPHPG